MTGVMGVALGQTATLEVGVLKFETSTKVESCRTVMAVRKIAAQKAARYAKRLDLDLREEPGVVF